MAQRGLIYAMALAGMVGCGSIGNLLEPDRVEYKSAGKAPSLEIPPDLTQLQRENRYAIPEANRGTATASGYTMQQSARPAATTTVAPASSADMRIERAGNQRWLVVKQAPEVLWPQIKDFWQDSGFLLVQETPQAGIMETDWAENRAKIPQDFIRNALGKALDSLYSTGERDKFRTRLERAADGSTEIYISHRGMQEVLVGAQKESTTWTPRPADPELEAEFLSRLMARIGSEEVRAKATVANAIAQPSRAKLVKSANGGYVEVDEGFDRAWRRVGLALDRVGFTVEDRDRTQGLYFVRYVDPDTDQKQNDKGFFSKLFTFGSNSDKAKTAPRYRVSVKGAGTSSQVAILNNDGRPETSQTADRILSLLNEQLK
ncbi:outer membrane protein assembly factor BamC [Noviherbaspirillum sp. CPCC 100848]|uniref:Outer membrane protein assembly factor BamC n=1 Tax=Noviherbaspirillum album TaxID=3080276 RepID=A0ABU6JGH7_9BURK|nr:outer membrane protein assembly factor BamC [Noviherbaspirillum sp. CPCC 100848]MEC4722395.1 outer membrane protein assembly factor BamC [Noviherbaspirillum sp. CPCC 100848]